MLLYVIMMHLIDSPRKLAVSLLMVLEVLSPWPATSLESALLPSAMYSKDAERPFTVTITHYESVCRHNYSYQRWGLMVLRHNVVFTGLRLGYRPPWQVAGMEGEPIFTECPSWLAPRVNTVEHYYLTYPIVRHLIPQGLLLDVVCRHLLNHHSLEELGYR